MGAEPVSGCEVGEPGSLVQFRCEPASNTGDRDSGGRFGPAGTGRNEPTRGGPGELADPVAPADDVAVGESVDDESVDDDPESSAHATPNPSPCPVAIAPPTPRATASAPTRPMYLAYPMVVPPAVCDGLGFSDE